MKTVCHVISGYFRNDARVFTRQCLSLKQAGYEVSVLTCDGEPEEILEGIHIFSCKYKWSRWRTLLFAKYQFLKRSLEINADIYQLHSPELLPLGLKLKKLGKKVVYDAHEDMGPHILEKEWIPKFLRKTISLLVTEYMRFVYHKIDEIISPHPHVVKKINEDTGKGILVANFPLIRRLDTANTVPIDKRDLILCYTGTVYSYSNQETTLSAISLVPNARYEVAGYIEADHKNSLLQKFGNDKVIFHDRLNQEDLRKLYLRSLIGVVVYDYKLNQGGQMGSYGTNKFFEYMEAGLPIICTDYTLWKEIVEDYKCGICVKPNDIKALELAINTINNDRNLANEMGINSRKAAKERFSWASENKKYLSVFKSLNQPKKVSFGYMGDLYKNILRLASGSALAQGIPIIVYPILTRIYTPEDFGTFATVILFSSLLSIIASGSYEHAILIAKSKLDSANLIALTFIRTSLILLISVLIISLTRHNIATLFNDPSLIDSLYYVPFIALGGVVFVCHSEWLVKYKEYSSLTRNRILQGVFLVSAKMITGISNMFSQALILGEVIGRFLTAFLSIITIIKLDFKIFRKISLSGIFKSRTRFSRFPKVMVLDQFLNVCVGSVHVLFIGSAFGPKELGYLTLLFSSLYLPITVISTSIKDVFRQKANIYYNKVGSCRPLYLELFKVTSFFALFPFVVGFFLAPTLFPLIFGEEWTRVGTYAQIMIPMYYIVFISTSLSGVLVLTEKINVSLCWQIFTLISSVFALYIGCYVIRDVYLCLILLAVANVISYIMYGVLSYYFALDHSRT